MADLEARPNMSRTAISINLTRGISLHDSLLPVMTANRHLATTLTRQLQLFASECVLHHG